MKHRIEHIPTHQLKPGRPEPIWPVLILVAFVCCVIAGTWYVLGTV